MDPQRIDDCERKSTKTGGMNLQETVRRRENGEMMITGGSFFEIKESLGGFT